MSRIFDMFGPSPIGPIEQHSCKVHLCAKQLYPFMEAVFAGNWDIADSIKDKIVEIEREADIIKRDLRLHLPNSLFLPISRTSLLELLSVQDRIANKAEDLARLITSRRMIIPQIMAPNILPFLSRCLDASSQASKAINELDELLESGFRGSEVDIVEEMILTLDEIEHDTDDLLANLRQQIFTLEPNLPAMEIFFLYKLVQWIGDLADLSQSVGSKLHILIVR